MVLLGWLFHIMCWVITVNVTLNVKIMWNLRAEWSVLSGPEEMNSFSHSDELVIWWRWWQNLDQDETRYWIKKRTFWLMTVAPSWTHCSACCAAWFLWTAVSSAGDTGESLKFNTNVFHLLHSSGSCPQGNEWHRKAILQYLFWTNFSYGCV